MESNFSSGGSSSSNSKSCITSMSHDHIFSILLLLPVESVVSFSMTCRRFRSLASSETLWEALCRREWGSSYVDALLASSCSSSSSSPEEMKKKHHQKQLSWKSMYQQVSQLDSLNCSKLSVFNDGGVSLSPIPRASHSLNFVSGCLVLFGGGCEGGRHVDDTWVAYVGNEFKGVLRWQKLNSGIPSGRFGHSCVVIDDTLILFGGINDRGDRHNDTWLGQFIHDEMNTTRFSWRLLEVGSIVPPPRGAHAGCCINGRKVVIYGGIGPYGLRLNDTWLLDLSDDLRPARWCQIVTNLSPPARSGHSLTCISGTRMIMFGGRGSRYEVLNDVWLLDIAEECSEWVQLMYDSTSIPNRMPLPRVGHTATLIFGGKILIYGGEDSSRHRKDDFWVFDLNAIPNVKLQLHTLDPLRLSKMWKRLKAEGDWPKCRSFHRACADHSGRFVYIFGGMVDGLVQPADLSGLRFDSELFLVELGLKCCNTKESLHE